MENLSDRRTRPGGDDRYRQDRPDSQGSAGRSGAGRASGRQPQDGRYRRNTGQRRESGYHRETGYSEETRYRESAGYRREKGYSEDTRYREPAGFRRETGYNEDDRYRQDRKVISDLKRQERLRKRRQEIARMRRMVIGSVLLIVLVIILAIFGVKAIKAGKSGAKEAVNLAANETAAGLSGGQEGQTLPEGDGDPADSAADGQGDSVSGEASEAQTGSDAADGTDENSGEGGSSFVEKIPEDDTPGAFAVFADEGDVEEITDEAVESKYIALVSVDDRKIVAGRDYDVRMVPASMTKVLTLLVAAEHLTEADLDKTFEITQELTDYCYIHKFSVVGFMPGDTPTIRDLLYGMILESGADAAVGLAEYISGSQEAFVELMNKKLEELGISDTAHFTNCIGLYDENHYCTALDMAVIMKAAVENETCREYLSKHTYTTTPTQEHPEGITISNWFLRRIEDKDNHGLVECAKTGFVNESGYCAVSYQISNEGKKYICVTGDTYHTWVCIYDHMHMYQDFTQ